ncbi:MAG: MoaD/ThiS family protein [Myxococcota bacterium]
MRVTARYFAALRERKGTSTEVVELPEGTTARSAYRTLCPPADLPVAFAVNEEMARPDTVLRAGDEVAFLPPIGGG